MRQADLVILVLGVLAATATLAGALSGDRWTDERTVRFATQQQPLGATAPVAAGGAGAAFNWTMPANATSADVVVSVSFEGQAVRGGPATVTLRFTGPDGKALGPMTTSWAIPQGATSAETQVTAAATWHDVPRTHRDTTSGAAGAWWDQPLMLHVVVQPPPDLPLATYGFTAGVTGQVTTYAAA